MTCSSSVKECYQFCYGGKYNKCKAEKCELSCVGEAKAVSSKSDAALKIETVLLGLILASVINTFI